MFSLLSSSGASERDLLDQCRGSESLYKGEGSYSIHEATGSSTNRLELGLQSSAIYLSGAHITFNLWLVEVC